MKLSDLQNAFEVVTKVAEDSKKIQDERDILEMLRKFKFLKDFIEDLEEVVKSAKAELTQLKEVTLPERMEDEELRRNLGQDAGNVRPHIHHEVPRPLHPLRLALQHRKPSAIYRNTKIKMYSLKF